MCEAWKYNLETIDKMRIGRIVVFLMLTMLVSGWISVLWRPELPKNFPQPLNDKLNNGINRTAIQLGRYLFFDPILSADSSISCASCHSPLNAFAHNDHALSHGIGDSVLKRNAPALFNLAWQSSFMWDGSIHRLYAQPIVPIENKKEMGSSLNEVFLRLNRSEFYRKQLRWVYGKTKWDTDALLLVLEAFQLSLISADSKYDKVQRGEKGVVLTLQEQNGYRLYQQKCSSCHREPLFSDFSFQRNHLVGNVMGDLGRYEVTGQVGDSFRFKVPSLRNLKYTLPYMHDGRFNTLSQVIKHYSSLGQLNGVSMHLTDNEQRDLIAFLLSLTDEEFVRNKNNHFPKERISD